MKKKIFVIGTGRSGTHWLGYILESSPEIKMNIEVRPIFPWVTKAAIDASKRKYLLPLITTYYNLTSKFTNKHFADKSHPNLWLIEPLIKYVPNSHFIGIMRDPHATISSMLIHPKVKKWCNQWKEFPVPNEFLGITYENKDKYDTLSTEAKCTLRWIAHKRKLDKVHEQYPEKVLIVDYSLLFDDTENELKKINKFLGLNNALPIPEIRTESKSKWKKNLSQNQIDNINDILKEYDFDQYIIETKNS